MTEPHWCRWEYRVLHFFTADGRFDPTPSVERWQAVLNKLGDDGWEAFAGAPGSGIQLKRQIYLSSPLPAPRQPSKPMSSLVKAAPDYGQKDAS